MRFHYHHRPSTLRAIPAFTTGENADDADLIDRLIRSYNSRAETASGQWSGIFLLHHKEIHDALIHNDRVLIEEILRNPVSCNLMYGFDSLAHALRFPRMRIEERHSPALTLDSLVTLAEALGGRRLENPENYYVGRAPDIKADDVIDQIENKLGFSIFAPNPFPSEYGIATKRGILSYRVPQALYQAWRISQLVEGIDNPKILEIGGGLGRTALYAKQFGIDDYTIIDIPISSLAQGYFLGRSLGNDGVTLFGEADQGGGIKLLPPSAFLSGSNRYDLILNVDSLTEIGRIPAEEYIAAIEGYTDRFLSINHEDNEYTVAQLIERHRPTRMPYWMRRGYVEEIVTFR